MTNYVSNAAVRLSTLAVLSLSALAAHASITGTTGNTTPLGSPPAACGWGQLPGVNAFAWNEQQNVTLSSYPVDMINNPGTSTAPVTGNISGTFDSHFIHFDPLPGVTNATGTVTFNGPIFGVLFKGLSLDNSDILLGAFGTTYPTGYPFRGLTSQVPSFFSINANVLSFNFNAMVPTIDIAQVRVLTRTIPAPGALATAGAAGLLAMRRRRRA